jgi:ribosomal protein S18 acetylase RimI-like enzyme
MSSAVRFDSGCLDASPVDLEQSLLVERHHAESFLRERVVPGVEVHRDRDAVWIVHGGQAWRNAGIMVRFSTASAGRRLDTLVRRYQRHRRGMALWISPSATPGNLLELLHDRGLRCRKYYPAMVCPLAGRVPARSRTVGLEVRPVVDVAEYERIPHPAIGPLTTPLRRVALERLRALLAGGSGRTHSFVAWLQDQPVGALELFIDKEAAGIHGLSVLDQYQRRGVGSALIEHACAVASRQGAETMVLLATTEGQRLYAQRGFREVARFGYWYRSFQRS